jgi:predicted nucleic-acid-binding protein
MIGIDTNILVRYLTQDDELQSTKATKLISNYSGKSEAIFINNIVLCELIWVLTRGYHYSKNQIITVLKEILLTIEFAFDNHKILWLSALEYENSTADFADILIGKLNILKGCKQNFTFDRKAADTSVFHLL